MKIKSMFTAFTLKALLTITCITIGFASFTKCDAQSIIGKWKGVSAKFFYSPEYAKQIGKSMEEKTTKEAGDSWGEYKADHTFTMSFSAPNSSEVTTMKGTWSLTGNQLKTTLEPQYNPQKMATTSTISIMGNTMITTAVPPSGGMVTKTISTSTRM
jgi:hypothetical protein